MPRSQAAGRAAQYLSRAGSGVVTDRTNLQSDGKRRVRNPDERRLRGVGVMECRQARGLVPQDAQRGSSTISKIVVFSWVCAEIRGSNRSSISSDGCHSPRVGQKVKNPSRRIDHRTTVHRLARTERNSLLSQLAAALRSGRLRWWLAIQS
jgi:hypothetical protein